MPIVRRQLGEQLRNAWRAAQHHVPHVVDVRARDVGIVGTDVHGDDNGPLVRDMLLSMFCKGRAGNCAKHIGWQFDMREDVSEDASLNVLQLLNGVVDIPDFRRLRISLATNAGIWVRLLRLSEWPIQFSPTLQQRGEFAPFRSETVFEIAEASYCWLYWLIVFRHHSSAFLREDA